MLETGLAQSQVLLVDTDEPVRDLYRQTLVAEGYDVTAVGDHTAAISLLNEFIFDLVLAEASQPERAGILLLQEANRINPFCQTILMDTELEIGTATEAIRLGAYDYMPKPSQDALLRVSRMALELGKVRHERESMRLNLEATFNSVKDGIITFNHDMNIVGMNAAASKFCGISSSVIGKTLAEGCPCHFEVCQPFLLESLRDNKPVEVNRLRCNDRRGGTQIVSLSITPLTRPSGQHAGAVMVVRDDTHVDSLEQSLNNRREVFKFVGECKSMQEVYQRIDILSEVDATVLITGESGTGKELAAEALHYGSNRRKAPLVKVNCAALTDSLLGSELFGHVKGAFTGAAKDKIGRFQRAHGGTIFLDEIGDISPALQIQLLRVLQEKEIERVGDSIPIPVDVRILAATNRNLQELVDCGQFRQDLYYRLNVVQVEMPPLRARREDIPLLVEHFIDKFNRRFSKHVQKVTDEVMAKFFAHSWLGNVRELEHVLEHASILCRDSVIRGSCLPPEFSDGDQATGAAQSGNGVEKQQIIKALEKTGGNKAKAARLLNIGRATLYRKLGEYDIPG